MEQLILRAFGLSHSATDQAKTALHHLHVHRKCRLSIFSYCYSVHGAGRHFRGNSFLTPDTRHVLVVVQSFSGEQSCLLPNLSFCWCQEMTLRLEDVHQLQLKSMEDLDVEAVGEFCKVASQFLQSGLNLRLIDKAAKKLEWTSDKMRVTLEALMEFFRMAARCDAPPEDVKIALTKSGLHAERAEVMANAYLDVRIDVRSLLSDLSIDTRRIRNLEWRFEVEVQSRNNVEFHTLQMDVPTMLHVTEELEQALQEVKSAHSKRIMRQLK